jgi:DNA-binding response OmpR family regulator
MWHKRYWARTPLAGKLKNRRQVIPIIFIAVGTDKTVRPRPLEQSALECRFKPFSGAALLDALRVALRANRASVLSYAPGNWLGFQLERKVVASINAASASYCPLENPSCGLIIEPR